MPTATYTPLANATLGSTASSVTFSSISQAYRDLVVVVNGKNTETNIRMTAVINGDTASNYYGVSMSFAAGGTSGQTNPSPGSVQSSFSQSLWRTVDSYAIFNFMDYSATNKQKTILCRAGESNEGTEATCFRWASTAAITTLKFESGYTMAAGTSFALYGIAA
jgi:hypothetical protein